jgi:glycosyltransferase involved in cell wall biosynthesis
LLPSGNLWLMVRAGLHAFVRVLQEQGRPEVIHAHSILYGGYLAIQIRERWQIPVVVTEHSTAFLRDLIRPGQQEIVRHTLRHADRRLAVGEALACSLRRYGNGCSIEVLGNLVNPDFFLPGKKEVPSPNFVFATVAALTPKKGIDVLLKAFAQAFRGEPILLRVGGDGGERAALEQQSGQLGIAAQVEFLGQLSREQVRTLLQQSHALVSSSYVETFGITLIEAMACGKPVVATRSGGPESFVNEGNGLLVPAGDARALAAAMQQIVRDYQHYDPNQIRASCVTRFGERVIVQQLEEIYCSLAPS